MRQVSLATKLFAVMCGLAITASGATIALLNAVGQSALREEVRTGLASAAGAAAGAIDGDTLARLRTPKDEQTQTYKGLVRKLRNVRAAYRDIRYIYIMRRVPGTKKLAFVVDADTNKDTAAHIGETYDPAQTPQMLQAFSGATADSQPTRDKWGSFISGYAPIRDSRGRIVAILGIDMPSSQLTDHESSIAAAAAFSLVIALVLVLMLGHLLANRLTHPVRKLTAAAKRVAEDDLDHSVQVTSNDEIGELAQTFNRMVEAVRTVRAKLIERANTDALTDLFNHRYFHERLAAEASRASTYDHRFCLVILDVDHFKSLNDTYGHPAGDHVLTSIASTIRSVSRDIDIVARYGGDEFAIIMPEMDIAGATDYAESIRKAVENTEFDYCVGESIRTTVSLGIAEFPTHHIKTDGLVMAADIALFRAKHTSRNRTVAYEPIAKGNSPIDPYELHKMLHDPNVSAIETLAAAVDARDQYTHGHSERVTDYSVAIAEEMGLGHEEIEVVRIAGLLHDVGKIGVPDSILNKPAALTSEERRLIQNHPSLGAKIVGRAPQLENVIPGILHHHERLDGGGYPGGLAGEDVPRVARILAVADSFDAMTSKRPYRDSLPIEVAVAELEEHSGTQFDPEVVEAFLRWLERQQELAA